MPNRKMMNQTLLLITTVVFLISCGEQKSELLVSKRVVVENNVSIPDDSWPEVYFKDIFKTVEKAGLVNLRNKHINDDGMEIRIWFHEYPLDQKIEAVIIEKKDLQTYSGKVIVNRFGKTINIQNVRDGWDALFMTLNELGVFNMPDSSKLEKGKYPLVDGPFYVFETLKGNEYRTFGYNYNQLEDPKYGANVKKIIVEMLKISGVSSPLFEN